MLQSRVRFLLFILLATGTGRLFAQTTTASTTTNTSNPLSERENNPYSKFGIGELWNGSNTATRGMANITSAFESPYEVNTDNPASYAFLQRTTFEVGAVGSTLDVSSQGQSYGSGTLTLAYLNLGIPLNKNAGMCFGFRPYTRVYYNLQDTILNSPIGSLARSYNGFGGLNYAYLGAAAKFKGFSLGFNFGYMFGSIRTATASVPIDTAVTSIAYTGLYSNYDRIGGLYWKGGFMYEHKLDSDYTFRIGGTLTIQQQISERFSSYQISTYNFGDTLVNDTASSLADSRGTLTLPLTYSLGVMLSKNDKWGIGIDYTATNWAQFHSSADTVMNNDLAKQSYMISLGGELTPNANDIRNYFSRVTYRLGFYYGTDYMTPDGTSLPMYGVTAGASLPFRRSTSRLHVSIDVGRLGTTANNLAAETYARFTIGISFNDKWFIPRKYD